MWYLIIKVPVVINKQTTPKKNYNKNLKHCTQNNNKGTKANSALLTIFWIFLCYNVIFYELWLTLPQTMTVCDILHRQLSFDLTMQITHFINGYNGIGDIFKFKNNPVAYTWKSVSEGPCIEWVLTCFCKL